MKAILVTCALALPALASAEEVGHWYLNPNFGGIEVDNRRPVEDKDWLYGLGFGKHLSRYISLETNLNGAQIGGGDGRGDLSLWGGTLDMLGVMNRDGWFSPYVSVGAGVVRQDRPDRSNVKDFASQAGVGAFIKLWDSPDGTASISLRPDLKVRWDEAGAQGTLRDYIGTLGFTFAFGAPKPAPVASVPPPPPPVAAPPPPPPPPPPPADTDHDGVTDDKDQCPGTPAGVAVDEVGCPRKGSITLEGVTFDVNSAHLTPGSSSVLDPVATDLQKYPRLRIELQGHTDSTGSDAYNLKLSQQRAEAVREYLAEHGVPPAQLVARGYGETMPIASNDTADGRTRNRRVVMFVITNPGDVNVQGEGKLNQ